MSRYKLKLSREVPNAGGFMNAIRVGLPVEAEMENTICIVAEGSYEFVPLNHIVLRQALLSSPEFCKQVLGLEIKDATIKTVSKPVTKEGAKKK